MATLVLSTVGSMLGGPIGGMLGSLVGQAIDQQMLGGGPRKGPRLGDLSVQTSSYGTMIPRIYGTMRVAGTVIWATELKEESELQGDGKSQPETVVYTYSASFAVALSSRSAVRVRRIWADGKLLRGAAGDFKVSTKFRFVPGTEAQPVDPLIASVEGIGETPAYRGLCLAIFEDLQLAEYGNRIPSLTFELVADEGASQIGGLLADASGGLVDCSDDRSVAGYAAYGQDIRAAIQPIIEGYSVVVHDDGEKVRSPVGAALRLPEERELGASAEGEILPKVERSQRGVSALPSSITLGYYDPTRDYQLGQARTSLPSSGRSARQVPLACVMDAAEAKTIAESLLVRAWAEREELIVRLAPSHLDLAPGAVAEIPGVHGLWIVEKLSIERLAVVATLRRLWRSAGVPTADPGRGLPEPDVVAARSFLALLDLPDLGLQPAAAPTLHLAAASPSNSWQALPIEIRVNEVRMASQSASFEAIAGAAITVLGNGQPFLFDEGSVEVQLANDDHWLQSRDDASLADGANLAMVGEELIQFGIAEPIAPGRFRLRRLLRGRRGTEWAMAGHSAGEPFVLLDARSLKPVTVGLEQMGSLVTVTAYGPANAADPPSVSRIAGGEALRPLAPCALKAQSQPGGGLRLSWLRRSKLAYAWLDHVDSPADASLRGYRVSAVGPSATIEREISVEEILFSASEMASFGAGQVTFTVRQVGDLSVSHPAAVTFLNP